MDVCLYNEWIQQDLDELVYVGRSGRSSSGWAFMCQVGGFAYRYRMKYTRGVVEKGEEWWGLSEFQIDKVALQKEISRQQLEEGIFRMD